MKKYTTKLFSILISTAFLTECSSNSNKSDDSDANNIKSEAESQSPIETLDGVDSKVVIVSEDMTIDNSQIVELPSDKLNSSVETILSAKGKGLYTVNADGSIYAIGTAATGIPSNKNGFINSRNIAYAKAEMRAKMEILRLAGEVVTSERNSTLIANSKSGDDPDANSKATVLEKAASVVDKSLFAIPIFVSKILIFWPLKVLFSPILIPLSATLEIIISFAKIELPEMSIASFPQL